MEIFISIMKTGEKMGKVLDMDLQEVLSDSNIPWDQLQNSTILVTGATGLIGGVLVRVLSAANKRFDSNMRLIAHGRNKKKGDMLAHELNLEFVSSDICRPMPMADLPDKIDYIFHCAAITKSADMVLKPVDVMTTAIDGTRNMLQLATEKQCRGFLYLSSMEVFGKTVQREVTERDIGYLDLLQSRSSYPESKRLCETFCISYAEQYALSVKIARLARTFGAGIPNEENDMRVANQFARKALAGKNIELHTSGDSIANCCYTTDAVRGLLTILLKGKNGEAYSIANPDASVTIREMANIVANEVCGGSIKVVINIPEDIARRGYAPNVGYILNVDKLRKLGWFPKVGLCEMYRRMLADWSESDSFKENLF